MKKTGNRRGGEFGWLVAILAVLLPLLMHPAPALGCPLTPGARNPLAYPDISGDIAVWQDQASSDIYLFNFSEGNETRLTFDGREKTGLLVSGPLVIWLENPPPYSLMLLNLTTGTTRTLSTDAWTAAITGKLIAWVNYTLPGISLYDAGKDEYSVAAAEPFDQLQVAISGNRIIWVNGSDPVNGTFGIDIFMKDLDTGTESLVTESLCVSSPSGTCIMDPRISGERVVWSDYRDYPDIDVYLLDLAAPPGVELAASDSLVNPSPRPVIDGDFVAWVDYPDISLDNRADPDPPFTITSTGVNNGPGISGNRVIYYRDDRRIYLYTDGSSASCPSALFTATPRSGVHDLAVQFTDQSSGSPAHWLWDFGDGTFNATRNPVHTYTADGTYSVSLTVSNSVGRGYLSSPDYIHAGPIPAASFSANRTYGITPLTVQFTDTSLGDPTNWFWDFGDGTFNVTRNPVHTYTAPGTYTVNLSAANDIGTDNRSIADYIRVLNGTSLLASTVIDGLDVTTVGGREQITLDTTKLSPSGNSTWLTFTPPPSSGWARMDLFSMDGIGFSQSGGAIRGIVTSGILESLELLPHTFGTGIGNNLPVSYHLYVSTYPVNAEIAATVWEGVIPEDSTTFRQILAGTSKDFTSILDTAYTLDFVSKNLNGVQSATLNLSVATPWVQRYGGGNNITVIRRGDDLVNQTLNPGATFTDTADNIDYFTVPSPRGLSRFVLVSAAGSSNLIQMGARVASQYIQGSGMGYTSGVSKGAAAGWETAQTPARAPVPRPAATYYGEGKIDTTPGGITRDPVIISSGDQSASLSIGAGVKAMDGAGNPLALVTIHEVPGSSVPPVPEGSGTLLTGTAYDIGPDGSAFDPPATVSFTVPGDQLRGDSRYSIRSYSAQAGSWEEIP